MLHLDSNSLEISNARIHHWNFFSCRTSKKITGINCVTANCKVCSSTKAHNFKSLPIIQNNLTNYLNNEILEKIICGVPLILELINNDLFSNVLSIADNNLLDGYFIATKIEKTEARFKTIHELVFDIESIFNYKYFIGLEPNKNLYSAYNLAENLNRRSCTYCNRTYTTTMRSCKGKKLMRPQFDHWFPKSKYPLLAISFYNLIPSCNTCNSSVKGDIVLELQNHIHPYLNSNQNEDFVFNYIYSKRLDKYKVYIANKNLDSKTFDTIKTLKIDDMYNAHIEELKDLIKIKQLYSDTYIQKIKAFFPKVIISDDEIFRLLFGTELNNIDFHKRPLSKFKSDILKELGIIK